MSAEFRLAVLAEKVGGRVVGDPQRVVRGVATLRRATSDELSFLTNSKYRDLARESNAGVLLVSPGSGLEGRDLLEADEPYLALAEILEIFHPPCRYPPGVSPLAHVAETARLGRDVHVAPFALIDEGAVLGDRVAVESGVVIGRDCRVGEASELRSRVVLYPNTTVGARCIVHSGVVLGSDGFGFATHEGRHRKVPQMGRVVLEDDVEIGANSTVDRGALDETRIGSGSKLDNLVMIAHGVQVGSDCMLIAQTGIAGSTRIGDGVTFAGQSGAAGHLEIGSKSVVAAKSAAFKDVAPGSFVAGIPAVDHREWKRAQAAMRRLPEMARELRTLRRRLSELEKTLVERDRSDH